MSMNGCPNDQDWCEGYGLEPFSWTAYSLLCHGDPGWGGPPWGRDVKASGLLARSQGVMISLPFLTEPAVTTFLQFITAEEKTYN